MTSQEFVRILRTRWMIICGTIAIAVLAAVGYSLLATPQYQASTRLFVSTSTDGNATQANDGSLFAQRRVLSYIQLLTGHILAQRTIDKLNLDMSALQLQQEVTAIAPTDTVLIDVVAQDSSPSRARDIANTLSDEFVVMAAELETPAPGEPPNARVLVQQRADIPNIPVTPKKTISIAVALVLGLVVGVILAIVRDRFDHSVRSAQAVEKATGAGVVGNIPFDPKRRKDPLLSVEGDRSKLADAFRELRTNLQFLEVGNGPRILLVASSTPREGRTVTAINLALALAEANYTAVVVDGDLRRPAVSTYLGLNEQVGLTSVLAGETAVGDAVQETRYPRVAALTSGPVPANPTELLRSAAVKDVLDELAGQFDYVIVDSSPLLVADAAILAGHAQGVVMIAQFGQTERDQLAYAVDALKRVEAPVLGAVVTGAPVRKRNSAGERYLGVPPGTKAPQEQAGPSRHGRPES